MVGDGDFVDAHAQTGNFGGDLGFEAEAVFLEMDALQDFASEGFEAGLHVGEVQVGEHIGEKREEAVADGMPEVEDAVRFGPDKTRAEHNIGAVFDNRGDHDGIFFGVVFEVGVLDDDDLCGGVGDTGAEGSSFALVDVVAKSAERGGLRRLRPET